LTSGRVALQTQLSPIPRGTTLRAFFLNEKGEAYVDLSKDVATAHTGGTRDELLTIFCSEAAASSASCTFSSTRVTPSFIFETACRDPLHHSPRPGCIMAGTAGSGERAGHAAQGAA